MKMKYLFSSLLSFLICISAFAQNNRGVDYFSLGEMKLAKEVFEKSANQTPDESYYFLGEIALKEGNTTAARANYEKGVASNPESKYSAIGLAKVDYKSNPKELEKVLKEIIKKNKKDRKEVNNEVDKMDSGSNSSNTPIPGKDVPREGKEGIKKPSQL